MRAHEKPYDLTFTFSQKKNQRELSSTLEYKIGRASIINIGKKIIRRHDVFCLLNKWRFVYLGNFLQTNEWSQLISSEISRSSVWTWFWCIHGTFSFLARTKWTASQELIFMELGILHLRMIWDLFLIGWMNFHSARTLNSFLLF